MSVTEVIDDEGSGLALILVAALAGIPPSAGASMESPSQDNAANSSAIQTLDYEAAVTAGIDVSIPADMTLCDVNPDWPGYDSAADATQGEAIADAHPACAADPRLVEYVVGAPQPTSDHSQHPYHHNGQETYDQAYEGGRGQFKVKNATGIDHGAGAPSKFVVGRVFVEKTTSPTSCQKSTDTTRWAEAGWSEVSWSNNDQRRVYTWGTADCDWRFYDQLYNIQDGQFYSWRVVEVSNDLNTYILWDDQWELLHSYNLDCSPDDCGVEAYIEIYSSVDGEHPGWSGHADVRSLDLKENGSFQVWDSSYSTFVGDVNPYKRCAVSNYDEFYVIDSGSC